MSRSMTPRQAEIAGELLAIDADRPSFGRSDVADLRTWLKDELLALSRQLPAGVRLSVSKHDLSAVLQCEGLVDARRAQAFSWNPATARGSVIHQTIEIIITSEYEIPPLRAASVAIDALIADGAAFSPGEFLSAMDGGTRLALVRDATDAATKFVGDWPHIDPSWSPRPDSSAVIRFDRITLRARPDLLLGLPDGEVARTLIVDFKTGTPHDSHRQDHQLYAITETLRSSSPPFRVASYYLDAGTWVYDDVDLDYLETAARRTLEGVKRLVELAGGREPRLSPGRGCFICPASGDCEPGRLVLQTPAERADAMP